MLRNKLLKRHSSPSQPKFTIPNSDEIDKPPKHFPKLFQWSLRIENLPPTIKTSHFNYILSHPIHYSGRQRRNRNKVDPGVTIIQIYHLPPPKPSTRFTSIKKVFKKLLCIPNYESDEIECATSSSTTHHSPKSRISNEDNVDRPIQNRNDEMSRVETREVPESPRESSQPTQEIDQLLMNVGKEEKEEEVETVAWIHFKDEVHLVRAKILLNSITIDGRKIIIKSDNFNTGLIKRIWYSKEKNEKSS